jgi:hypothetical protein
MPDLSAPPDGYDSVHGTRANRAMCVRSRACTGVPYRDSEFASDEYAIYDTARVRLAFLVELRARQDTAAAREEAHRDSEESNDDEHVQSLVHVGHTGQLESALTCVSLFDVCASTISESIAKYALCGGDMKFNTPRVDTLHASWCVQCTSTISLAVCMV